MFNLNFGMDISLARGQAYKLVFSRAGPLTKNFSWEFALSRSASVLALDAGLRSQGDHRGLSLGITVLTLALEFSVFDRRHWEDLA